MKTLFAFALFTGLSYSALAHIGTTPEPTKQVPPAQEIPKKINPAQMTLPFFKLMPLPVAPDSLKRKDKAFDISSPNIIDPRRFEYRTLDKKTII